MNEESDIISLSMNEEKIIIPISLSASLSG
jgi:hypothetical protein